MRIKLGLMNVLGPEIELEWMLIVFRATMK
jgi:hypothetical protein